MKRYFAMKVSDRVAEIDVYGDITSWEWLESDVSSYTLAKTLEELKDVDTIIVNINSYGGEVKEGVAIYNALMRHPAKVITRVDGFACSIASVIFMAGEEREMYPTSLLMIHNALLNWVSGNANDFRKVADDLDVITNSMKNAYLSKANIDLERLTELMDQETWISSDDALSMGFSTGTIAEEKGDGPTQSAKESLMKLILGNAEGGDAGDKGADPVPTPKPEDGEELDDPAEGNPTTPDDSSTRGDEPGDEVEPPDGKPDEAEGYDEGAMSAFFDAAFHD